MTLDYSKLIEMSTRWYRKIDLCSLSKVSAFETASVRADRHRIIRLLGVGPDGPTLATIARSVSGTLVDAYRVS